MQYQGGKHFTAGEISAVMLAHTPDRASYWEPFLGAASVAVRMVPHFNYSILSDIDENLILMWAALKRGDFMPPSDVSEEMYAELRHAEASPLRGFVGYGCSFGGKWFGGYARTDMKVRNYAQQSANSCLRKAAKIRGSTVGFIAMDYMEPKPEGGWVIYCDPPYAGTTGYQHGGDFDSAQFAARMQEYADLGCTVFVSEYRLLAPTWERLWHRPVALQLAGGSTPNARTEGLYLIHANTHASQ